MWCHAGCTPHGERRERSRAGVDAVLLDPRYGACTRLAHGCYAVPMTCAISEVGGVPSCAGAVAPCCVQ